MNKRGAELFPILIGLLLFGIIAVTFLKLRDISSDTTLERGFIARDFALLLDAVYASPGDVSYVYDLKEYRFRFDIDSSAVYVREKDNPQKFASYRYSKPADVSTDSYSFTSPKELEIRKTGNFVRILPHYSEPDENAKDEFQRFAAFLSLLKGHAALCKSVFSFDQKRLSGYFIVYRPQELSLYKGTESVSTAQAPRIGFAVHLPPDQAFENFESSVQEVAFGQQAGHENFIAGDATVLQKGTQLAFGEDRYSQIGQCTAESGEKPEGTTV